MGKGAERGRLERGTVPKFELHSADEDHFKLERKHDGPHHKNAGPGPDVGGKNNVLIRLFRSLLKGFL